MKYLHETIFLQKNLKYQSEETQTIKDTKNVGNTHLCVVLTCNHHKTTPK